MSRQSARPAAVAAKWWADQLRTGFEPNNGSADEEGTVANTLANNPSPFAKGLFSRTADEEQCTPERVDAFEAALAKGIQEMLDQEFQSSYGNTFSMDSTPDPILLQGARRGEMHGVNDDAPLEDAHEGLRGTGHGWRWLRRARRRTIKIEDCLTHPNLSHKGPEQ